MKKRIWIAISSILAAFSLLIPLGGWQGQGLAPLEKRAARHSRSGYNEDYPCAIAVDGSGNVYVTGDSEPGGGSQNWDYATIKYDTNGKQLWAKKYNGPGNRRDNAYGIAVDGSGNVYVTGYSEGIGSGSSSDSDYATIKYSTNGQQLWVKRYNGPGSSVDGATAIAVDGSGDVYVTGYSVGLGASYDIATIKYSTNGKQLWATRYNGPDNGGAVIAVDGLGNVYVTGLSGSSGTWWDYATIKYNTNGKQLWVKRYNGPGYSCDLVADIAVDGSGNVYVTGDSEPGGDSQNYAYATIKYNTNGKQLWVNRYNGKKGEGMYGASALAADGSGNVYVTGCWSNNAYDYDFATIKYGRNGKQLWVKRYPGLTSDNYTTAYATAIAIDGSGNVYVTGGIGITSATIKYSTNGKQLWVEAYKGPGNYYSATAIAVDGSGNVYVTGKSHVSGTEYDYTTVKYDTNGRQLWVQRYDGLGGLRPKKRDSQPKD